MQAWLRAAETGVLGRPIDAPDRRAVFERNDPTKKTYFLSGGAMEIFQRSADGLSVVVKILVAPTLFGQIEPLANMSAYLESVRVAGGARFYAISPDAFKSLVRSDAALGFECLVDMSSAFCVSARYEPSRMFDTEALLANLVVSYARIFGENVGDGTRISLKRSQADLAEAFGAGERSVNRILAEWKNTNLIVKSRGCYVLKNTSALEKKAGDLLGSLIHAS